MKIYREKNISKSEFRAIANLRYNSHSFKMINFSASPNEKLLYRFSPPIYSRSSHHTFIQIIYIYIHI